MFTFNNKILLFNNRITDTVYVAPTFDPDAQAFITAHETATGLTMGLVQKEAINNRYLRYKGILPNPNGSDLWTLFNAQPVKPRIWIACPVNDSIANSDGFRVEFLTKTLSGTYNNFVSGDFTPQGVIGGLGKFFSSGVAPISYSINSISHFVYARNAPISNLYLFGANDSAFTNITGLITRITVGSEMGMFLNDSTFLNTSQTLASVKGLCGIQRDTNNKSIIKNGLVVATASLAPTSRSSRNIFFHGRNNNGVVQAETSTQLAGYFVGIPILTANQLADFNWIEQLYQTEIITGGRQV